MSARFLRSAGRVVALASVALLSVAMSAQAPAKAKAAAKLAKYRIGQAEPVRATVLQASQGK